MSGYNGAVYSDFLPIDIDSTDLEKALKDTRVFLLHLNQEYEVDMKVVRAYFSGSNGFHIELPSALFGFEPSQLLPDIFKRLIQKLLLSGITVDESIYNAVRLWRLPNTLNSKSGLYKIPLTVDEVFNSAIIENRELAKHARDKNLLFCDSNISLNPIFSQLYSEAREESVKKAPDLKYPTNGNRAYEKLFSDTVVHEKEGRNNSLFSYGCKLRAKGLQLDEIELILSSINATCCKPPQENKELADIVTSVNRYETEKGGEDIKPIRLSDYPEQKKRE